MRVAFVGAGRMGGPMVERLVAAGHSVIVADVRPVEPPRGAAATNDAVAAVRDAEVVVSMLPTSAALLDVAARALPRMPRGAIWIDMGSNPPLVADELVAAAAPRGVHVLDAPVGGGPEAAQSGGLALYVGGDPAVFERCRELLGCMAEAARIHFVGRNGAGYRVKLLINLLWFGQAVATAEALMIAQHGGIDLGVMHDALRDSAVAGRFVERDLAALLGGDYVTTFSLQGCYDELVAVAGLAEQAGTPFTVSTAVMQIYRQALDAFGAVDGELMAVAFLEAQAQTRLRR